MFRANETWKHMSTLDVNMYFVKIPYRGPIYIKAKVYYEQNGVTLNPSAPDSVKIQTCDFWKWKRV